MVSLPHCKYLQAAELGVAEMYCLHAENQPFGAKALPPSVLLLVGDAKYSGWAPIAKSGR